MEHYKKIRIIGRGGFGTVYLCRRLLDNHLVILKEITVEQMSKDERQIALNESQILSMLDHPNVIAYHENLIEDQKMIIVMEYAEGGTLCQYIQDRDEKSLTEDEALMFFTQLVIALQYIHSNHILHRDLKSQNILLNKDKNILKIGDFGISKILNTKSAAITFIGTPYYLSPELCQGEPYDQKSDIWALGCILYEILMLKRPFMSENLPAIAKKIMMGYYEPLPNTYSMNVQKLLRSMLHLDPYQRPNASQIMAQPFMTGYLYKTYMSLGCFSHEPNPKLPATIKMSESNYHEPVNTDGTYRVWSVQRDTALVQLPLPRGIHQLKQITIGKDFLVGVTQLGRLIMWLDDNEGSFTARLMEFPSLIRQLACTDDFVVCLAESGVVSVISRNSTDCTSSVNSDSGKVEPKVIESLFGDNISTVACGPRHVLALSEDSNLFAWGLDIKGCLGLGQSGYQTIPRLVEIRANVRVEKVFCGPDCSFAITENKVLLGCGSNRYNKLAMDPIDGPSVTDVHVFTMVHSPPLHQTRIVAAASGVSHSAFLTDDGKVLTVGSNKCGQLGWGDKTVTYSMPDFVSKFQYGSITSISCGDYFTLATAEDSSLYVWGKHPKSLYDHSTKGEEFKIKRVVLSGNGKVTSATCYLSDCLIATR